MNGGLLSDQIVLPPLNNLNKCTEFLIVCRVFQDRVWTTRTIKIDDIENLLEVVSNFKGFCKLGKKIIGA